MTARRLRGNAPLQSEGQVLLRGNLKEFSLPNILQLVNMSAKSGALTIRRDDAWGRIYFRGGLICYAFSVPQDLPLGERLVRDGIITPEQLRLGLIEQEQGMDNQRIGAILLKDGVLDRVSLEHAVREQIQDAAFDFFGWPDGEFDFRVDEQVTDEDILVEMHVENVIMEGCRRIDEWELFVEHIGPMERIPRLACPPNNGDPGDIILTPREWRAVARIDGRADISTVLRDAHLDRFHGAKVMYGLYSKGLITVGDPVLKSIDRTASVAVRGPIDIYNEVFLNTLTNDGLVNQLRVELIDEKEIEIPMLAGQVRLGGEGDGGVDVLVFTAAASAPDEVWRRIAADGTAWIVLANANDADSLRATRLDLEFVRRIGGSSLVVGTYVSMADDELDPVQVAAILGLDGGVPVIPCQLRERASVVEVVQRALQLAVA